MRSLTAAVALVCALVLAACGETDTVDDEPTATPSPRPTPTVPATEDATAPTPQNTAAPTPQDTATEAEGTEAADDANGADAEADAAVELAASCTNPDGFTVAYPEGWVTNTEPIDELPPCSVFDPETVEWEQSMTVPLSIAVFMRVHAVDFDDVKTDDELSQELSREELQLQGHDAVRIEVVETGEGMHPAGTHTTYVAVELGEGETLIATTHDVGDLDYERKQDVLDAMMEQLTVER